MPSVQQLLQLGMDKQLHTKFEYGLITEPCPSLNASVADRHYYDVIMIAMTSQITSALSVYSTVGSDADQRKYQSSASLAFVRGIHRWPVNSPHIGPVTRKMFPFDDVIMAEVKQAHLPYI